MILGLEIGLLIAGIIALTTGKFKLSKVRVATGAVARIAGLVMMLPLPLALAAGFVIGLQKANQGKAVDIAELHPKVAIVEICIVVVCALLGFSIALIAARPREDTEPRRRTIPKDQAGEHTLRTPASSEEEVPFAELDEEAATGRIQQLPQPRKASGVWPQGPVRRPPASAPSVKASGSRVVWWVAGGLAACFFCCAVPAGGLLVWWLWPTPSPQPTTADRFAGGRPVLGANNPPPGQKKEGEKQNQKPPQFDLPARGGPLPPGRRPQPPEAGGPLPPGKMQPPTERPILPPARPGPVNRPPRLATDQVEKMLPSTIADVAVGGGGRYLILYLPQERKLAVFDVSEAKIKGYVPAAGSSVKFAAGREKLLVALGGENIIQRWNLATLQREVTAPLPVQFKISLIGMGSNSDGPLLVASADGVWRAELFFMDIMTLKKLPIKQTGDSHIHIMEGDGVRASADGRVFGLWSIWMGTRTLVLEGQEARGYHENGLPGHLIPGPDGKVIYTAKGRYNNHVKPLGDRSNDGPYCLPAVQGDYYLTVKANSPQGRDKSVSGTLAVHVAGDERPLITLPEMDLPASIHGQAPNSQTLPADKRIYFIPAANLIVIIPDSSDRLVLQRFDVMQALEKSGIDYLFVVSHAPVKAKKGATYRYQLAVKSKQGGVKYRVESGPQGMKISDTGLLTWDVPRSASEMELDVLLTISDKSGQEIFHKFCILPGDQGEKQAAPATNIPQPVIPDEKRAEPVKPATPPRKETAVR
jgi:hypothetical protein